MSEPADVILLLAAFLTAGVVKGTVGMGLPTTALAIMTLRLDPRLAIALILIPMVVTNAWQVHRSGNVLGAIRRYWVFGVALMVSVGVTVVLSRNAPDRLLLAMLGGAIVCFVLVNTIGKPPALPPRLDRRAQAIAGVIAGVMGGFTSVWAPPLALYLAARKVAKDEFVRASGLLIFVGSLPLISGYAAQGELPPRVLGMSCLMLIPALVGFAIGERLRHAMSETLFRKVMLGAFFVMGINLLRKAFE